MIFCVVLADATMSYIVPVVMQHSLGATQMGLILAISSFVGTFMDFTFARLFTTKKSNFFMRIVLSLVLLFPLSFLFFRNIPSFVFAMVVWGVYFEAMVFSNYHAIHEAVEPVSHAWAWGSLATFKNIGWFLGPLIASFLEGVNDKYPFYFAIVFYVLGIILFLMRRVIIKHNHDYAPEKHTLIQHNLVEELKIWRTYFKTIWPLLGLSLIFMLIDSTFFSIGPVFGENLKTILPAGGFFISMYTLPGLLFGVFAGFLAQPWGKKRTSFVSGILAGVGLILMSRVQSVWLILATTFFASAGLSVFYPEITAVFEDYVARSRGFGNDLIGLTACMGSIAYVVGPIINGFLADHIGTQSVFGLWGWMMLLLASLSLVIVKRKVRLPQKEIEAITVGN